MITAVDTNVLIDVFLGDPIFGNPSATVLRRCFAEGRVVACEVVWAELAVMFPDKVELDKCMAELGVDFVPMARDSSHLAGVQWKQYLDRGGSRSRVIADFLIAAHAQIQCDQLLTRDRGFHRECFSDLKIIDPAAQ